MRAGAATRSARVAIIPARPSFGQLAGLHATNDPLDLKSSVALVVDQDTQEVLLSKNDSAVLPIASLTKLMTGLIISEAHLPMDEMITIVQDDVDTEKNSSSRLVVGATLSRGEMLHLALMSSENRAAHALGAHLSRRLDDLRHVDERQSSNDRNDRHQVRRTHRPFKSQPVQRPGSRDLGERRI